MPESEDTPTTISLDEPVSAEQFKATVERMLAFMDGQLRSEYGWCAERYRYFEAIIPGSSYDGGWGNGKLNVTEPDADADLAALLREARGKILWYTSRNIITLSDANRIFSASGLPAYKAANAGTRMTMELCDIKVTIAADSEGEARDWIMTKFVDFITRMADGKGAEDGDLYVPGSLSIGSPGYVHDASLPLVDNADTVRPSYNS